MSGIEAVVFHCPSCKTRLITESRIGAYFDGNTCPECRKHIRVQQATRSRGLALFVDVLKHRPRREELHKRYYYDSLT